MTEIDALIDKVNKRLKSDVLVYGNNLRSFQRTSTGSLAYDLMLGGGWPLNTWNEIVGLESHGKTVMALKTIAALMRDNPKATVLWIASEDFNEPWATALGVDTSRLVVAMTNAMEDAYEIIIEGIDSQQFDAVVLDSYPALVPSSEADSAMDEWTVGLGARLTNKLMRLSPAAQRRGEGERNCLCLIINQWRDKIGVTYGDPRTTPGGKGKNFSFFTRVEVVRDGWIEAPGKVKVGQIIKARTMKNKTAPPARTATTQFYFDDSFPFTKGQYDNVGDVWAIATTYDVIERKGAWYNFQDYRWNGKEAVLQSMREDLDLQRDVTAQVRHFVLGEPLPTVKKKRAVKRT